MRLIDADAIDEELENWKQGKTDTNSYDLVNHFQGIIRTTPTVEERKHGHWVKTEWGEYQCSVCKNCEETTSEEFNEDLYFNEADFMERNKFCRQCGAIMDEVGEDEK